MTTDQEPNPYVRVDEPTPLEQTERPIVCPACGAEAVRKDDMLITDHALDCAWLQDPNSQRYDSPTIALDELVDILHDDEPKLGEVRLNLATPPAGSDDRGEQGAGLPHEAPLLPSPTGDPLIPLPGSLRRGDVDIAQREQDIIDEHIRLARELIEGSANNMSERSVQLSLAHSAAAQAMMTRWLMITAQQ